MIYLLTARYRLRIYYFLNTNNRNNCLCIILMLLSEKYINNQIQGSCMVNLLKNYISYFLYAYIWTVLRFKFRNTGILYRWVHPHPLAGKKTCEHTARTQWYLFHLFDQFSAVYVSNIGCILIKHGKKLLKSSRVNALWLFCMMHQYM